MELYRKLLSDAVMKGKPDLIIDSNILKRLPIEEGQSYIYGSNMMKDIRESNAHRRMQPVPGGPRPSSLYDETLSIGSYLKEKLSSLKSNFTYCCTENQNQAKSK